MWSGLYFQAGQTRARKEGGGSGGVTVGSVFFDHFLHLCHLLNVVIGNVVRFGVTQGIKKPTL